jgi:O-antigen/teichoic acid export membrane protein
MAKLTGGPKPGSVDAADSSLGEQDARGTGTFMRAAATTYGAAVAAAALSLVNVLITARTLGPTGRGELAFLTTIALLTATLSSLGVEEANGNLAGLAPGMRPALATNSLLLSFALGGIGIVFLIGLVALAPGVAGDASRALLVLALVAIPFLIFQIYLQFLIRADYGFAVTNIGSVAAPVLTLAVNATLVVMGSLTVGRALGAWVAGQVLVTTLLAWYVWARLAGFGRPRLGLAGAALRFGVLAHAGRVMKTGNYRLDQWLLGSLAGPRELGLYSVAVAWSEAIFYLPEALMMVIRPDVVRASRVEAARRTATVFRFAIIVTAPVVAALILAAPILCVTVFGDRFRGSIGDLRLLAPGAFGIIALKLLANSLTAQRKPMLGNVAVAVAFAATIALDLLLIPRYGGAGAAAASTVAYSVGGVAVAVIFSRALGAHLRELIPRPITDTRSVVGRLRAPH